jgi:hypothetical protein
MTPEVTKTVLNKIILNVWTLDRKWTSIIIWPRDRASISVQQLCIIIKSMAIARRRRQLPWAMNRAKTIDQANRKSSHKNYISPELQHG